MRVQPQQKKKDDITSCWVVSLSFKSARICHFLIPQPNFGNASACVSGNVKPMRTANQIHDVFVIYWSNGVCIFRANNKITAISEAQLRPFLALETLDLSNNNVVEIKSGSFPALPLKNL